MDRDELYELIELRTKRDSIAIIAANAAVTYFNCLDIGLTREELKPKLDNLNEIIKSYRDARKAYYNFLRNHKMV